MKRIDLIRHLESQGCEFMREGKQHSLYINRQTRKSAAVPASSRDSPWNCSKHLPRSWNSVAVLKRFGVCTEYKSDTTPFAMLSIMRQQELSDRITKMPHDRVAEVAEFVESRTASMVATESIFAGHSAITQINTRENRF